MLTRSQIISNFLTNNKIPGFAQQYTPNMEVQVTVARGDGELHIGEHNGKQWKGWIDHETGEIWKNFRIPMNAMSEPINNDGPLKWDFDKHVSAIGLTGWDFVNRVSKWVGFDFDAIVGHSDKHAQKLSSEQLEQVRYKAMMIPWVHILKSTSGNGLHLYVQLENFPTRNHTEHSAVARAILSQMSALCGYNFFSSVDVCGQVLWVYYREKMNPESFKLLKEGDVLDKVPTSWRDHLGVASRTSSRSTSRIKGADELVKTKNSVDLDSEHQELINHLAQTNAMWNWDSDRSMLICHTYNLQLAHNALGFRGIFRTMSTGSDKGHDWNCFGYPIANGGWVFRRYGKGTAEDNIWDLDEGGWTRCYYNVEPSLDIASRSQQGIESDKGSYVFRTAEQAKLALIALGADLHLPNSAMQRRTEVKLHKDGRVVVLVPHESLDDGGEFRGWLLDKNNWKRIYTIKKVSRNFTDTAEDYDELMRHIVVDGICMGSGWLIAGDEGWREEPLNHVKSYLKSLGLKAAEVENIIGRSVRNCWFIENKPFQPEYLGNRKWNRSGAQFTVKPSDPTGRLSHSSWDSILEHLGRSLNSVIERNAWCKDNEIVTGADYLTLWVASLFKAPEQPLPYLFFYSEQQNTGKSSFHEALDLLCTAGVRRADNALINPQGFNAELEGAILGVIEETDLSVSPKTVYNRIKDWVTSPKISIHRKGMTPYEIRNTVHWVHCANHIDACPVFPGDTRIVYIHVDPLETMIPKAILFERLKAEAPDFLAMILSKDLPKVIDRLNLPVIETLDKLEAERINMSPWETFLDTHYHEAPGERIKYSVLYDHFVMVTPEHVVAKWTNRKCAQNLLNFIKGRDSSDNQVYIANISATKPTSEPTHIYGVVDEKLFLKRISPEHLGSEQTIKLSTAK